LNVSVGNFLLIKEIKYENYETFGEDCLSNIVGVDNGAAGAAAAAPIIWLVVVLQKLRTFRRSNTFFFAFMNAI